MENKYIIFNIISTTVPIDFFSNQFVIIHENKII